jgi:murein L,D-transpeptidase YafK
MKRFFNICGLLVLLIGMDSVHAQVDCIEIIKHQRIMKLIRDDKVIKTYKVSLGRNPKGAKRHQGDKRTPEGTYFIKRKNPNSQYHLSLEISYPNPEDRARATKVGVEPGNNIMIHGLPNYLYYFPGFVQKFHLWMDWTQGCIAVTDHDIEEIYQEVEVGTPVIIFA